MSQTSLPIARASPFKDSVAFDVFNNYDSLGDRTGPVFDSMPTLPVSVADLKPGSKLCVQYVYMSNMSTQSVSAYYNHIILRDTISQQDTTSDLITDFPTPRAFWIYCQRLRRVRVVQDGWVRANVTLPNNPPNRSGCYRCPLKLLRGLLTWSTPTTSIIPFEMSYNDEGDRIYSTPWNTDMYASYNDSVSNGSIVLIYLYSNGATMSKSGTQSLTFLRVRFSNVRPYTEEWYTVGLAPSPTSIPATLPDDTRRRLRLQLIHRFIFLMLKAIISASYTEFVVAGRTYYTRVAMLVTDQPEEGTLVSLSSGEIPIWIAPIAHCVHARGKANLHLLRCREPVA